MNALPTKRTGPGLLIFLCLAWVCAEEVVYDNTSSSQKEFYPTHLEFGDEITLGGKARILSTFSFEYYGDFKSAGDDRETLVVRFYANDGGGEYSQPGSLLFESDPMLIRPGFNTIALKGLTIRVPEKLTWTVEFKGISGLSGSQAGLLLYDPPKVGKSFNDFWQRTPDGWKLFQLPEPFVANFGARALALNDTDVVLSPPRRLPDGGFKVFLRGPKDAFVLLEVSSDLKKWDPLEMIQFTQEQAEYVDSKAARAERRFYRTLFISGG